MCKLVKRCAFKVIRHGRFNCILNTFSLVERYTLIDTRIQTFTVFNFFWNNYRKSPILGILQNLENKLESVILLL